MSRNGPSQFGDARSESVEYLMEEIIKGMACQMHPQEICIVRRVTFPLRRKLAPVRRRTKRALELIQLLFTG